MRNLLRLLAILALLLPAAAPAQFLKSDPADRLSTIPDNPGMASAFRAAGFDMLVVQHEGWRETLPTFARLKIYELTGRDHIPGQDPVFTILSMIYASDAWYAARFLPVEHPDILPALGLDNKWVSPKQIVESPKLEEFAGRLRSEFQQRQELDAMRKTINAVVQTKKLGNVDIGASQAEFSGVSADTVRNLLANPEELARLREKYRAALEKTHESQAFYEAGQRLLSRAQLFPDLPGQLLLVPDTDSADDRWVRPAAFTGTGVKMIDSARALDSAIAEAFASGDAAGAAAPAAAFLELANASRAYPKESFRTAQNIYVARNPWRMAAGVYLLATALMGAFFFWRSPKLYAGAMALAGVGYVFHTAGVVLRGFLTGHIPVSNMFESITFCSWALVSIGLIFEFIRRNGLVAIGCTILAFLLLSGSSLMPLHQTRIHPLRAVLNSYWLNIHVTMMLISYAAFGIAAFFSALYLVRSLGRAESKLAIVASLAAAAVLGGSGLYMHLGMGAAPMDSPVHILKVLLMGLGGLAGVAALAVFVSGLFPASTASPLTLPQTEEFSYRLVQVGWPLLTFGITLGAVWADTAWGRYWGWDPKETWAFITWVAYTLYLHSRMVMGWRGRWSAAACLAGFIMVMITWWGVSYIPWFSGGLHSYASPG